MTNSVTFSVGVGGDGSTVTDGSDPTTGLDAGGHRTRFVPALAQTVAVAANTVTQATNAAASAASALNAPGTNATSTTSLTVGTGNQTFTIQTGKAYVVGQTLVIASTASPANQMTGIVTAYNSGTGSMTVNVSTVGGAGTFAAWTVSMGVVVSSTLPSQTGNANKALVTNGTVAAWVLCAQAANNLSELTNFATARTNLGLGSLAVLSSINGGNWSGTDLAVVDGGTGASTAAGARTNLGAAASGANSDITSLSALSTALSIVQGGTGATTAAGARTALGLGSMATQGAGAVAITGGSVTGITDITIADGGTGASDAATARANLGAASSGANSDITSLGSLSTALTVAQGGTGGTTKAGARTGLGCGGLYDFFAICTISAGTLTVQYSLNCTVSRSSAGTYLVTPSDGVNTPTNAYSWIMFGNATGNAANPNEGISMPEDFASRSSSSGIIRCYEGTNNKIDPDMFQIRGTVIA